MASSAQKIKITLTKKINMQSAYSAIAQTLTDHKIYFSTNGTQRHKPEDVIAFAEDISIEPYVAFLTGNHIFSMGCFSYSWSALPIDTTVGRYCSIARGVGVMGARHPYEWITSSSFTYDSRFIIFKQATEDFLAEYDVARQNINPEPLQIGNDVWIGANVVLKRGIKIGTGSVIAGNSVVTKDVPPYAVVGGNPAKIIKMRFPDEIIAELVDSEWWKYKYEDFQGMTIKNPSAFVKDLRNSVQNQKIAPYQPKVLDCEILLR